jgi:hypothetical protein
VALLQVLERADALVFILLAAALVLLACQAIGVQRWRVRRARSRCATAHPLPARRCLMLATLSTAVGCVASLSLLVALNRLFVWRLPVWEHLHQPAFHELRYPVLEDWQARNLGWAHRDPNAPRSSYLHHPMPKPAGVYRIGCFGDSFTAGDETAPGHDYPSFLQDALEQAEGRRFEVINFGVRAYGMQQAFLMYEYLGRQYALDAAIFLPFAWHDTRDTTFNYDGLLHARYILTADGLRLVPIDETTRRAGLQHYYRLFPPWKYWLYDRQSPHLLSLVLPLGKGRPFNPFYYVRWQRYANEVPQLYTRMFARVATEVRRVLVVANDAVIEALQDGGATGVTVMRSRFERTSSLLTAPRGHLSAHGNRLRAGELAAVFLDRPFAFQAPALVEAAYQPTGDEAAMAGTSLAAASQGWMAIAGHAAAGFFMQAPGDLDWQRTKKVDFSTEAIHGLVQLQAGSEPLFVPVDVPMQDGAPLAVRVRSAAGTITVPIGTVECALPVLCRARFHAVRQLAEVSVARDGWTLAFADDRHALVHHADAEGLDVLLAERLLLRGRRQHRWLTVMRRWLLLRPPERFVSRFDVAPAMADYLYLRAEAGQDGNPQGQGALQLCLRLGEGTVRCLGSYLRYDSRGQPTPRDTGDKQTR